MTPAAVPPAPVPPAPVPPAPVPLVERVASTIRSMIARGELLPGQRLSETGMAERQGVSRNTLREAFRSLTHEGLVTHTANRGVSVSVPSMAAVIDIYRIRRMVEVTALRGAFPQHPQVARMAAAVDLATACAARADWVGAGNANMDFHAAIVALSDSPRLISFFTKLAAELRLAFGLLDQPETMHAPYIPLNREIVALVQRGDSERAAQHLHQYLEQSERVVLAALARQDQARG